MSSPPTGLARFRGHITIVSTACFAVAALVEIAAVFGVGFPDWYFHAAMWILLGTYGFLATTGFYAGKLVRPWVYTLVFIALSAFWASVMVRHIPESEMILSDNLLTREPLPILWVSVGLLSAVSLGMLILAVLIPRGASGRASSPAQQPPPEKKTSRPAPPEVGHDD